MPGESIWFLLIGGLLCALGALGGIAAERRRLRFVIRDQAARNVEMSRRLTEMEQIIADVQIDNKTLSSFLVVLPDVVRRLNGKNSARDILPLLASTLEQLFEPRQVILYTARGNKELVLTYAKGLPEGLPMGHRLRFGEGRIGLAAKTQMTIDRESMQSESSFRRNVQDGADPAGMILDLIAPMVHEGITMGVICVGAPGRRHRDDKRMIKLVADLGSLALNNILLFNKLERTANMDSLTGLSTKRFLNFKFGDLTHQAEQTHQPLSVIIMDIDHFKRFNDTYGHLAGDQILKLVATIMRKQLRTDDIAARYGGEEFVLLLPNTPKEDAVAIAEKIRLAIERYPFPTTPNAPGRPGAVTISGGVAAYEIDGHSSNEILGAADQALYLAKGQGRNRIVAFMSRYLSDDEAELDVVL